MNLLAAISDAITLATGTPFVVARQAAIGGGCINRALKLTDGQRSFFVKVNSAEHLAMFEAEAAGLDEVLASRSIRVPRPVCRGTAAGQTFLVLEYLELRSQGNAAALGRQLAQMHRTTQSRFGWRRNNTIGSTPQLNPWTINWLNFLRDQRLGFQLRLASENGYVGKLQHDGEKLLADLNVFFTGYSPAASLLHGDLWGGNYAFIESGEPVIYDPAVYYGDREADLAMTELFGGFPSGFYAAYHETWPLDAGYAVRKTLYNLYHILNHANLFGGGYAAQAERMIAQLLAHIR